MPEVAGNHGEETPAWIDYEFRVLADPGTQLRSFTVRDTWGMTVELEPTLEPCTTDYYTCVARRVARNRYPLSVEVTDCDDNSFGRDEFPQFGVWPRYSEGPGVPFPCTMLVSVDNPPCEEAQRNARIQRNLTSLACNDVRNCREEFARYTVIAAIATAAFIATFALAGVVSATGGWIGAIVGAVLFAVAAAFFVTMVWAAREAGRKRLALTEAERDLRQKQTLFNETLILVYDRCCPGDIHINTDMPCGERELL